MGALQTNSKIDEAENLGSSDFQHEEDDILSSNDDFEVCSSHLTESDIGSHSDIGHPREELKIGELPRRQKSVGESEREKK